MKFATDGARPSSLLLAEGLGRTTVDRVALDGSQARVVPLATLSDALPIAFSPSGAHLLYLAGHNPPALWVTGLAQGRLVHPHRLLADARDEEGRGLPLAASLDDIEPRCMPTCSPARG